MTFDHEPSEALKAQLDAARQFMAEAYENLKGLDALWFAAKNLEVQAHILFEMLATVSQTAGASPAQAAADATDTLMTTIRLVCEDASAAPDDAKQVN